jgi:hypothetical protein
MIEIIAAYLLVEGGAGVEWWLLYAAVLVYKAYILWQQQKIKNELIQSLGRIADGEE